MLLTPSLAFLLTVALIGLLPASTTALRTVNLTASSVDYSRFAALGQYPYQVSIHSPRSPIGHICAGAIVKPRWIFTSASCTHLYPDTANYTVRVGSNDFTGGQEYAVESMVDYPSKSFDPARDTMSLWRTAVAIVFNEFVQPIPVAIKPDRLTGGETMTISGWGSMYNSEITSMLKHQTVQVLNYEECKEFYAEKDYPAGYLCIVRQTEHCEADLGSPIVANGKLYGGMMWSDNCNKVGKPERINEVFFVQKWFLETIAIC